MAQLIVYINSEQKASAYYNNSYLSFHGARYASKLTEFSEIVQEELDHSVGDKKDEISVLIVSNGATNETVRTVIKGLLHTNEEEGVLNVDFQELNVIESKYFLPMLGNPETPEAEDFARFFEFKDSYSEKLQELDVLTSEVSTLKKIIEGKDSEISELQSFKDFVIKAIEKRLEKQTVKTKEEVNKTDDSNRICKINLKLDCRETKTIYVQPNLELYKKCIFHRQYSDQVFLNCDAVIGTYIVDKTSWDYFARLSLFTYEIAKKSKRDGKIFYVVEDQAHVEDGDVVAVIGDEDWTSKDVVECLKRNSYNIPYINKIENNPLIYDSETH